MLGKWYIEMWNVGCGMFAGMWDLDLQNANQLQQSLSGIFNVNFEHMSDLFLVFLLLTLNM